MNFKKVWMVPTFATLAVFASACGGGEEESSGSGSEESSGSGSEESSGSGDGNSEDVSGSITASGSTAMQPLVTAASEQFMEEYPDASVQVQGGGSGTGLSQIADDQVDIGNSDIFAEAEEDIDASSLEDHKVAVVGMTAAVNEEAGVEDLTQDELIDVFTGEVTNWEEVGGNDQEITLVNRPGSSGTRATFNEFALDGESPADGITENSSNNVAQIVSDTEGAVGYNAFSYFEEGPENVVAMSIDGVEPTDENVQSGDFPVWAYQHSYTNGEPEGLTEDFLDYMLSEEVQESVVTELGYIPVTGMEVERNAEGETTEIEDSEE